MELSSSSLASLSLVSCRAMTALDLSCPNLLTVNLDGCDHLEKASFCPVSKANCNSLIYSVNNSVYSYLCWLLNFRKS